MSAHSARRKPPRVGDAPLVRRSLIAFVLIIGALLVVAPLLIIGVEAFSQGVKVFTATIGHPDTRHAILLTVITALIAVPVNTAFGIGTSWFAVVFYNYFTNKVDKLTYALDEVGYSIAQTYEANHTEEA